MKLKNISYSPSKITNEYWIFCKEDHISKKYPDNDGKWMMFFPLNELDLRWNEACGLFRAGKLKGISAMKASTAKPNPKAIYANGEGIIIFYCGPSENRENVLEYGKNILIHMYYPRPYFFYKSDKPHLIKNDNMYKHLYFIRTFEFLKFVNNQNRINQLSNLSLNKSKKNPSRDSPIPNSSLNKTIRSKSLFPKNIHDSNIIDQSNIPFRAKNIFNKKPQALNIRSHSVHSRGNYKNNSNELMNQSKVLATSYMQSKHFLSKSIPNGLNKSDETHVTNKFNDMRSKSVLGKNLTANIDKQKMIPETRIMDKNFYINVYKLQSFFYTDTVADVKRIINIQ